MPSIKSFVFCPVHLFVFLIAIASVQSCVSKSTVGVVPEKISTEFGKALIHANTEDVIRLVEEYNIDCNGFLDKDKNRLILMEAITVLSEYQGSSDQFEIINYLLDRGANPNLKVKEGYNSLHVLLSYHNLSKISLAVIEKRNIDVNAQDDNGNNLIFVAIREYNKTWRPEQQVINELRLNIIEKLLEKGADLDIVNKHGFSPRRWLEVSQDERLHSLIRKYENLRTRNSKPIGV